MYPATIFSCRLCSDLYRDVSSGAELSQSFPDQVLLVKYEQLVQQPERAISTVLNVIYKHCQGIISQHFLHQFLGLPWHRSMTKFVSDHMRKNKVENNPFHATSLNSSEKVDQWRSSLSQDELNNLLRSCGGVTDLYKNISMF